MIERWLVDEGGVMLKVTLDDGGSGSGTDGRHYWLTDEDTIFLLGGGARHIGEEGSFIEGEFTPYRSAQEIFDLFPKKASFILGRVVASEDYAATTRENEVGRIGLPGGKVEAGELPQLAAIREAAEEGWIMHGVDEYPFYEDIYHGYHVRWYAAQSAERVDEFKEKGRITPVSASLEQIAASGFLNDKAIEAYNLR